MSLSDANLVDHIKKTCEESLQKVLPLKERLLELHKGLQYAEYGDIRFRHHLQEL